jgi:transcriptional regulator with XRE-family HTH domain
MVDGDLGTVLAVLRIIRGWNQEELARASGLRSGTISDYERGKMAPGINTMQRLLESMGYAFAALDHARTFIASLRADSLPMESLEESELAAIPPALRRQVVQISAEAGRVVSRLTRLMFVARNSPASGEGGGSVQPGD